MTGEETRTASATDQDGNAWEATQGIGAIWESLVVEAEGVGEAEDGLVLAVVHAHGQLRSGGSGAYGAAHAFTVGNGRITRFREYVDLDTPLAG